MYEAFYSNQFFKATKKLDPQSKSKLKELCEALQQNPYDGNGSHTLSYEWAGFRGADLDGKHRVIFRICEECFLKHQQELNSLSCCQTNTEALKHILFLDFGDYHRSAGANKLKKRDYDVNVSPSVPEQPDQAEGDQTPSQQAE